MAEKIRCNTCGYMLDPDARFCPMCFAPASPGSVPVPPPGGQTGNRGIGGERPPYPAKPSAGSSGKLVAVIIATAVEAMAVIALIVLAIVGVKSASASTGSNGGGGGAKPTPAPTAPAATAEPVYAWSQELTDYMNTVAPGSDVTVNTGIDKYNETDYANALDPNLYGTFAESMYGADFSGAYPLNLFCYVTEQNSISETQTYGTVGYRITFAGNDGTVLRYEYIAGTGSDAEVLADSIIDAEAMRLYADTAHRQKTVDNGVVHVLVCGTDPDNSSLAVMELLKVEGSQIFKMTFEYPASSNPTKTLQEQYVAECLVRLCDFSGETKACRSFADFQNGIDN